MNTNRSSGDGKYNTNYKMRAIYAAYVKDRKKKKKTIVSRGVFSKIIHSFNQQLCEAIVKESIEYRMPYRLGYLRIRKHKTRIRIGADNKIITDHMKPDWVATKKLWEVNEEAKESKKLVYHTNTHSQRYYYKWLWDKNTCNITNSSVYKLIMTRANKRMIAETIKNNDQIDYYE